MVVVTGLPTSSRAILCTSNSSLSVYKCISFLLIACLCSEDWWMLYWWLYWCYWLSSCVIAGTQTHSPVTMQAATRNGTVDVTEDSDTSLLIVNGDDETVAAASDDDDVNMTDAVFSDGSASNPVFGTERTGATNSLCNFPSSPSADVSGSAIQDAVANTLNNVNCRRHRRRYYRHHRSVQQFLLS